MQSKNLSWDDVRVFLALYRAPTMAHAAKALGVDPSTVSRRLGQLEATLDTVLFDRGRDGLRPTQSAEALRSTAEQVEEGVVAFTRAADGLEREVAGVVRVACPPDVADVIMLPVLSRLMPRHPKLRMVLVPGESLVDLARREADMALRIVRPRTGDLVVTRALSTRFVAATHPGLAEFLGRPTDLSTVPWVGAGPRQAGAPSARWLEDHMPHPPVLRTDSLRTQIAAAAAGLCVALVPAPSVAHYGLTEVDLSAAAPAPPPPIELYLMTHRTLRRVPRIATVWQAVLEHFAELAAGTG